MNLIIYAQKLSLSLSLLLRKGRERVQESSVSEGCMYIYTKQRYAMVVHFYVVQLKAVFH